MLEKEEFKENLNLFFAKANSYMINSSKDLAKRELVTFANYTKKDILNYLASPSRNEKHLRVISRYCYNAFGNYRRLINYTAQMYMFHYYLEPSSDKIDRLKGKSFEKAYIEACRKIDKMKIPHEFSKITNIAYREDVFYGYIHENDESFFIQSLNPDYCTISSIDDGVFNFAFDFAFFDKDQSKLDNYPKEFKAKYNKYMKDKNLRWQELEPRMTICLKVNEDISEYAMPPFSNVFESLYEIADYKALKKTREEIGNYQLISMRIPMSKDKPDEYLLDPSEAMEYYKMANNSLPPYVGLVLSPMDMESIKFEKDSVNTDRVSEAEQTFWNNAGVNSNLFNSNGNSGAVVDLSIKTDEAMAWRFMKQIERWINRKLKMETGKFDFNFRFMPITINNQGTVIDQYLKLAQFGIPVKFQLCSAIGMSNLATLTSIWTENDVFKLHEKMIPLQSSFTQNGDVSGEGGRPKTDKPSESTERTRNADSNNGTNRVGD